LTRRSGNRDMTDRMVLSCSSLTQRAPYRGIKGTNGTPKHTASLSYRNCGIAYTGDEELIASFANGPKPIVVLGEI
jgi:hypothetical protein